jgi:hypothetical protein
MQRARCPREPTAGTPGTKETLGRRRIDRAGREERGAAYRGAQITTSPSRVGWYSRETIDSFQARHLDSAADHRTEPTTSVTESQNDIDTGSTAVDTIPDGSTELLSEQQKASKHTSPKRCPGSQTPVE